MEDALISVAMAAYNGERFIREQMDSILSQTYKNIEVVVCDDCSTDSTWKILQEYAARDGRVKCFQNKANLGFKKNFEKAISLCSGEFIALSDQDDIWLPQKLEVQLRAINAGNGKAGARDIACSSAAWIDESGKPIFGRFKKVTSLVSRAPNDKIKQFAILCVANFVQGATIFAKARALKECLPIPDLCEYHDWWFALNAAARNGMLYIPKQLVLYRRHPNQATWKSEYPNKKEKSLAAVRTIRKKLDVAQSAFSLPEEYLRVARDAAKFNESQKCRDLRHLAYSFRHCGFRYSIGRCLKIAFARVKKTAGR